MHRGQPGKIALQPLLLLGIESKIWDHCFGSHAVYVVVIDAAAGTLLG